MEHEAFPNVVLEAMRASLPVVTSDVASLPYIVEDGITGFICEKKNTMDFEQKLIKLIENKKLREDMGKQGRERFLKYFSFEKVEKELTRVMTNIIND
jgi:glycosyltransferase involved in cell wall biosynthesis